jgi:hypothetical protein
MLRIVKPRAPRMGQRPIDELQTALEAQTVTVPAETTIGRVIAELALELGQLAAEIEVVFASQPQAPVLLSIPGNRSKDRSANPDRDR